MCELFTGCFHASITSNCIMMALKIQLLVIIWDTLYTEIPAMYVNEMILIFRKISTSMQYNNNFLSGFFIFIFYVLRNDEARKQWKFWWQVRIKRNKKRSNRDSSKSGTSKSTVELTLSNSKQ